MCNTARGRLSRNEEMINSFLMNAMRRRRTMFVFCHFLLMNFYEVEDSHEYPFNCEDSKRFSMFFYAELKWCHRLSIKLVSRRNGNLVDFLSFLLAFNLHRNSVFEEAFANDVTQLLRREVICQLLKYLKHYERLNQHFQLVTALMNFPSVNLIFNLTKKPFPCLCQEAEYFHQQWWSITIHKMRLKDA
jgi:hypothetical protein